MRILIIILAILITSPAIAQEFRGGLAGGVLSSQVDGDQQGGYNKASFHIGAFVQRTLSDKIDANMELRYIRKGALSNKVFEDGTYENYFRSRLNYIEIPVTALYKTGNFKLEGGFAAGALINSSLEDEYGKVDLDLDIARSEVSLILGFFYVVNEQLQVNFRIQYSLTPISKAYSDDIEKLYYSQGNWYNNLISFGLYYNIR